MATKRRISIILLAVISIIAVAAICFKPNSPSVSDDYSGSAIRYETDDDVEYYENADIISAPLNSAGMTGDVQDDVVYLSDIPYLSNSSVGWGSLLLDKTSTDGAKITLNMNGSWVSFDKGIYAHAESNLYYDLSAYGDYDYFQTYYGVNSTSNNKGDGVKFWVYTSNDGSKWTYRLDDNGQGPAIKSGNSCGFVKIDIRGWRYLRLQCYRNGNNANDHSCWADAKLVKEGYKEFVTDTVEEYDAKIRAAFDAKKSIDDELELMILQRYLVNKVGNYQLKQLYRYAEYRETFDWLFYDLYRMRTFINGGDPEGTWYNALVVLSRLYHAYAEDLEDERRSQYNIAYKDIFLKQMFAISLVYSRKVEFWIKSSGNVSPNTNISDAVKKYEIYKTLFLANKLNNMYGRLEVEEMRAVVWGEFADDEAYWLNDYTRTSGKSLYAPYSFTFYKKTEPAEYRQAKYYGDNRKAYENKYKLAGYNIANDKYYPKSWMIMQNGGQCWQVALLNCSILNVNGIPAYAVVQWPTGKVGHQAYLSPWMTGDGNLNWGMYNDAYGWDESTTINVDGDTRRLYTMRLPLGWGHGNYVTTKGQASYLFLGQAALNNYNAMCKAAAYVKLADSYSDANKKEEIYKKAISEQSIFFDAWLKLVDLYNSTINKSGEELAAFISDMCEKLKGYPLPMYDLHRRIIDKVTDSMYKISANGAKEQALNWAATYGSGVGKHMANYLLGKTPKKTVTFSFSSNPANKLVFQAATDSDSSFTWDYSIDGGETWTTVWEGTERVLTHEEVDALTESKDILVHIIGLPYTTANYFKVDLVKGANLTPFVYANNNEKRMTGINANMEWRYVGDKVWTRSWASMNLVGEVKIEVRNAAANQSLPGNSKIFTFTESESSPQRTYISIGNNTYAPSVIACSSENNGGTLRYNVFDMQIQGGWVSKYDAIPYIDIELANPTYVSRVQWICAAGRTDAKPVTATVYAGVNGKNWTTLVKATSNVEITGDYANIDFEPVYTKYLRIAFNKTTSVSGGKYMVQVGELGIFRDITKIAPDIDIEFSTLDPTKDSVNVTLTPAVGVTIPLFDGLTYDEDANIYTYEFEENKRLSVNYINAEGNTAVAAIDVDWIDKVAPTYKLVYNTTTATNGDVTVVCTTYEPVTFEQPGGDYFHTFTANGDFTFHIVDRAGNESFAKAEVNWIDTEVPVPRVSYLPKRETDYPVTADIVFDKKVELTNDNGEFVDQGDGMSYRYVFRKNGEYELKFKDRVGNVGSVTLSVDWIRPGLAETFITYESDEVVDEDNQFNSTVTWGNVTAKLTFDPNDHVTILNNGGSNEYVFYENGTFEFVYRDERNNIGRALAAVDWIEKELPVTMVKFDKESNCVAPVKATFMSSESVTVISEGGTTHTFTENGTFSFMYLYTDSNNNVVTGIAHATVDWIDNTPPTAEVKFDYNAKTDRDVVVTLIPDEEVTVINNGGSFTYTFTNNGEEFTFEFVDAVGLHGEKTVTVDWIDRNLAEEMIFYDVTETTGGNVTAMLIFGDGMNNYGNESGVYVFTENGDHIFRYTDADGNVGAVTAKVTWIDKQAPVGEVIYNVSSGVTVTEKDQLPVVATLRCDKQVTVLNNGGSFTREFEYNGSFTFEFVDEAGNVGTATATVNCIKVRATVWAEYNTTETTAGPVVVTLKSDRPITVTSYGGATREVKYNESSFDYTWRDEAGYTGSLHIYVDWIVRTAPSATVSYSPSTATSGNVTATLVAPDNRPITVTAIKKIGKDGNTVEETMETSDNFYEFTENGRVIFVFKDNSNIVGSVGAQVTWIDRVKPEASVSYSTNEPTCRPVSATLTFTKNGTVITNTDTDYTYIRNANGTYTVVFDDNGTLRVNYRDPAGNENFIDLTVSCIDKVVPTVSVKYEVTEVTKDDVRVKLTFSKESVITDEDILFTRHADGTYTVIFTENGEKTVHFADAAGNENSVTLSVDLIDRTPPEMTVSYSTEEFTVNDVTAYFTFDEQVTVTCDGVVLSPDQNGVYSVLFDKNTVKTVVFRDMAGNQAERDVKVDWIDRMFQSVSVSYSPEDMTNGDVTATLTFNCDVTILNMDVEVTRGAEGVYTLVFTSNGEYEIFFRDIDGYENYVPVSVDWIDKEVPTAHVEYSTHEYTNGSVTAVITFMEKVIITETDAVYKDEGNGVYTVVFTENTSYGFEFEDVNGNKNRVVLAVTWIDTVAPKAAVSYNVNYPTNGEVTATVIFDEFVYMAYEGHETVAITEHTFTFTENGKITLAFTDIAGNTAETEINVTWIDKDPPIADVTFDSLAPTSGSITATVTFSEPVTMLSEVPYEEEDGAVLIYFVSSRTVELEFADMAGNVGRKEIIVDWIFNLPPSYEVEFSTTETTRGNVEVTVTFDDEVTVSTLVDSFTKVNDTTYTFIAFDNGEFYFEFEDELGNKGELTVIVDWIDRTYKPHSVVYSTTSITAEDVIVTISCDEGIGSVVTEELEYEINSDGSRVTFTVKENGNYSVTVIHKDGGEGIAEINVTWIDRVVPAATVEFDPATETNGTVTAKVTFSEPVTVLNNLQYETEGNSIYIVFRNNEVLELEFADEAGNVGRTEITVDWIDADAPQVRVDYSTLVPTKEDVTVILIFDKAVTVKENPKVTLTEISRTVYAFVAEDNGVFRIEFTDDYGNENSAEFTVDTIDRTAPIAEISYDITDAVDGDVTAAITFNEDVYVSYEGYESRVAVREYTYVFTENGTLNIRFTDLAGNEGTALAEVSWIDKTEPTATVEYTPDAPTNGTVKAKVIFSEKVTVLGDSEYETDGDAIIIVFEENGALDVEFEDSVGHKGSITLSVDWIYPLPPELSVTYNTVFLTTRDVTVTLKCDGVFRSVTTDLEYVRNEDGSYSIKVTENGNYEIEVVHEDGTTDKVALNVDWIVKSLEPVKVTSDKKVTADNYTVVWLDFIEEVIILNTDLDVSRTSKGTYEVRIKKNGTYNIRYKYADGTVSAVRVTVDWIEEKSVDGAEEPGGEDIVESGTLSKGAIIGISVGAGVLVLAGAAAAALVILKRRGKGKGKNGKTRKKQDLPTSENK